MSFKDLRCQDRAVFLLKSIIKSKRIPAALLFWGEDGVGKKLAAVNFAKTLNCEEESDDACGRCASCVKIDKGNHSDVRIVPKETDSESIKIEEIRDLQKCASLKNFEGKKKVFIIDEAHNLTAEAANAFLKILEEPPSATLFILVSSKHELLFSTIISRCQKVRFAVMDKKKLENILENDYAKSPEISHYLAYFYQGRLGASLRMKDKEVLEGKNNIIERFMNEKNQMSDDFSQNKQELKESLEVLLAWLRDIYLIKTGMPHSELINPDSVNQLLKVMPRLSFYDLDVAINSLSEASLYLEQNINPKLILANLRYKLWTKLHK